MYLFVLHDSAGLKFRLACWWGTRMCLLCKLLIEFATLRWLRQLPQCNALQRTWNVTSLVEGNFQFSHHKHQMNHKIRYKKNCFFFSFVQRKQSQYISHMCAIACVCVYVSKSECVWYNLIWVYRVWMWQTNKIIMQTIFFFYFHKMVFMVLYAVNNLSVRTRTIGKATGMSAAQTKLQRKYKVEGGRIWLKNIDKTEKREKRNVGSGKSQKLNVRLPE